MPDRSWEDLMASAPNLRGAIPVVDFDDARHVLRSESYVQGGYALTGSTFLKNALTTLDGEEHLKRRRIIGRLFAERSLAAYRSNDLEPVVSACLAEVRDSTPSGELPRVDLVDLSLRMIYRVAARIVGIDGLETPAAVGRFIQLVETISKGITADWATGSVDDVVAAGEAAMQEYAEAYFRPAVERRRSRIDATAADGGGLDLITAMYRKWDDSWDEDLVMRESAVFLLAATQTTSQALPQFFVKLEDWLAEHPEHRHRVLDDPEFLRDAIFESLRFFVAAPARMRRSLADDVLPSGLEVPAGKVVALFFKPANMHASVFGDDAAEFNPLRKPDFDPPWGLAFGSGPHACVGRPLVTGSARSTEVDGTMLMMAKRLYGAGLVLEPASERTKDERSFYDNYTCIPAHFTQLT